MNDRKNTHGDVARFSACTVMLNKNLRRLQTKPSHVLQSLWCSVWWLSREIMSLKVVLQCRHWGRTRVQAVNRRMLVETATVSAQLDALA